jgi:nitroimidazol reductase NimA-like FMN-containing flavoprotein (pyridoxamine 5'-phosphate oxidase superfamily)
MQLTKTARTKVNRAPKRAHYDRELLNQIIDEAIIGHLAFYDGNSVHSIPMPFWRMGDFLYLHCSRESRLARLSELAQDVCISFTILDGLVLAKSAFSHSMNYRSVVVYGKFQLVEDATERLDALKAFMNLFDTQRWDVARQPNCKELAATAVLKLPLEEAAVKMRQGPPSDKAEDQSLSVWSGVIPLSHVYGEPIPDEFTLT